MQMQPYRYSAWAVVSSGVFDRAGVETNIDTVDRVFEHCFGETRPCELNAAVARAAALADQTPDPQLAALIAVAVLARCPHYLRLANLRGLANDGAVLAGPWGGALTVPLELRRFLATWHHEHNSLAGAMPLFPGNSHGRASQPAIGRRLARLDAPASLWEDPPDTIIGDGAHADGGALLLRLSAWHLWLDHPDETPTRPPDLRRSATSPARTLPFHLRPTAERRRAARAGRARVQRLLAARVASGAAGIIDPVHVEAPAPR